MTIKKLCDNFRNVFTNTNPIKGYDNFMKGNKKFKKELITLKQLNTKYWSYIF